SGWTAGGGVEWAFADNWTAKVEYLYVNLGNGSVNCATIACLIASGTDGVTPNGPAIPVSVGLTENLFRVGVNYNSNFQPRTAARPRNHELPPAARLGTIIATTTTRSRAGVAG